MKKDNIVATIIQKLWEVVICITIFFLAYTNYYQHQDIKDLYKEISQLKKNQIQILEISEDILNLYKKHLDF